MEFTSDKALSVELIANREAYRKNKERLDVMYDAKIKAMSDSVIGGDSDITTHLAIGLQCLAKLVEDTLSTEEKAALPDGILVSPYLVPDRATAIAILAGYAQAMLGIMQLRGERDALIAACVLPHPDIGI